MSQKVASHESFANVVEVIRHYSLPLTLLLVGIIGFAGLKMSNSASEGAPPQRQAPLVETVQLRSFENGLVFETDGQVVPFREVVLGAEVAGRVAKKWPACETGRYVLKGSPLLQIDPSDYEIEVRRITELAAQADLEVEELGVERTNTDLLIELAESELELRLKELRREETLVSKRAGSEKELDIASRAVLATKNAMRRLKKDRSLLDVREKRLLSEKKRLVAELEKAQLNVRRAKIVAPVDGVITADAVEEDGYVAPGTMLAKMEDVSKVEVRFNMRMDNLQWFWRHANVSRPEENLEPGRSYRLPNLPVTVQYDLEGQTFSWQGHLSRYDGAAVNLATRTVPCIVAVDDPRQNQATSSHGRLQAPPTLMRGMFVTVRLRVPLKETLLAAPEAAIRPGNRLWIVEDGKLKIQEVNVLQMVDGEALIMPDGTDLSATTQTIVSPLPLAVDGMEVRLEKPATAVAAAVDQTNDREQGGATR